MTEDEDGGSWDEDEGYSYHERQRIKLPSATDRDHEGDDVTRGTEPLIGGPDTGRMHPAFPEVHDYLQDSLKDLDLVSQDIWALKSPEEDDTPDDAQVTVQPASETPQRTITEDQTDSDTFREQRLRREAYRLVQRKLKAAGKSDDWIKEHRALIRERVDAYLDS